MLCWLPSRPPACHWGLLLALRASRGEQSKFQKRLQVHGFPSLPLWSREALLTAQRPRRVQEDKPEGGMGTKTGARSKGWEDQCCTNSTALLQGIKSGGVPGGPGGWFYGGVLLSSWFWMAQHCTRNPLLPQAENGMEMVLMVTF